MLYVENWKLLGSALFPTVWVLCWDKLKPQFDFVILHTRKTLFVVDF